MLDERAQVPGISTCGCWWRSRICQPLHQQEVATEGEMVVMDASRFQHVFCKGFYG